MKRLLVLLWLVVVSTVCVAAAAPMSKAEFTREFVAKASAELKDTKLEIVAPLQVHSKDVAGKEMTLFLDNAYAQYTSDPSTLQAVIANYMRSIGASKEVESATSDSSILAVVKPVDYLDGVKRQLAAGGPGNDVIFQRINEDLVTVYVFDTESSMRIVMKKDLEQRGTPSS